MSWPDMVEALQLGSIPAIESYEPLAIAWFCGAVLGLVVLKRLLSNSLDFPEELSRKRVLLNRFLLDRDVDDRAEWVGRIPK